jgi:hypothetical protein
MKTIELLGSTCRSTALTSPIGETVLETLRAADGKNKLALAKLPILRKRHCRHAFGIDLEHREVGQLIEPNNSSR